MRILFCDDNPNILRQLERYVSTFCRDHNIAAEYASYTTGEELLNNEKRTDIAFLDVEMTGISGIHVGRQLKAYNPSVKVFIVTSYPDYLDEAMKFQVFRYLSKPIDRERLFRNLKDALNQYMTETHEYTIQTKDAVFVRQASEIICVAREGRDVKVYTPDISYLSVESMTNWFHTLTLPCFVASHRSYLVNMSYISRIERDSIHLRSGEFQMEAYLTRRKYKQIVDKYLMYLESVK